MLSAIRKEERIILNFIVSLIDFFSTIKMVTMEYRHQMFQFISVDF